ncbi:E3 ubiquitin-protein ligase Rnf220-like [Babylonia areolata]|uniref:E3 ubiquitin-protein ligase Rnf220-like n=1 Tax=Babylonia areolata TaxID=304850 RepID=UPI003FD5F383
MSIDLTHLAMYRFNFWPKPFFPPTAPGGVGGMENSPFVPNPLSSPALMVLASTAAEGREAPRLPAPPHPFSAGQSLDKDLPPAPPPPFSSAGFVYRPGEPFPSPLYAPLPPFVRPNLDRGLGLLGPNSGAFRHLGPHEGVEPYHSAFTPAKKSKSEDVSSTSTFSSADHQDRDGEGGSRKSLSPSVKEERPSSISSVGGDTNSEIHSDNGDPNDRGTPDSEGRALRKHRKRPADGHVPCCPICGLTLRPGETAAHLSAELDKLELIFRERKISEAGNSGGKTLPSPSGRKGKDSPSPEAAARARFESYMQIRAKRQSRLHARSRNRKRRSDETVCPICNARLSGTPEELNGHVELCLKKHQQRHCEGEEEAVDVEGDGVGEHHYEEYPWAGAPSRIRTTALLPGGLAGARFQAAKRSSEDEDLNVDGDDSEDLYGRPQYTESDLVPLASDDAEGRERLILRGAVLGEIVKRRVESSAPGEPSTSCAESDAPLDLCQSGESVGSAAHNTVAAALTARMEELGDNSDDDKQKCLICMKAYEKPLVSVQCWHVLCEKCWCRTLGAKKLCPQCNAITSPSHLRRIYL